jgi:hypothetical protein
MTTKNAMDMTDDEFETAIRQFAHAGYLARAAAEEEDFLVKNGLKAAKPPTLPPDLPNAKPFDAQTDAYLRRQFPDHAEYMLKRFGLKETKDAD